jgi:hypothetical protein
LNFQRFFELPTQANRGLEWASRPTGRLDLMARSSGEQKRIESWFLVTARNAGVPIPYGEIPGEEPDFRFQTATGALGIELTEVLRPASTNHGILPIEEESFHREIIEAAQKNYYAVPTANPVHVNTYFTNARGKRGRKGEMAHALSEFVQANVHRANPAATFMHKDAPDGFDSVVIVAEPSPADWSNGEAGGCTVADIRPQIEGRILAKNELIPTYRSNLPDGAELWLLLYTGVTVARSMPIPHGIETWQIPFQFDRVFWFTALEHQFAEILNG